MDLGQIILSQTQGNETNIEVRLAHTLKTQNRQLLTENHF